MYSKFENLKIITSSAMVKYDCIINIQLLYNLLYVSECHNYTIKKNKIPLLKDKPGDIITLRFENLIRGYKINDKEAQRNVLEIWMSYNNQKNIHIKLYKSGASIIGISQNVDINKVLEMLHKNINNVIDFVEKYENIPLVCVFCNCFSVNIESGDILESLSDNINNCVESKYINSINHIISIGMWKRSLEDTVKHLEGIRNITSKKIISGDLKISGGPEFYLMIYSSLLPYKVHKRKLFELLKYNNEINIIFDSEISNKIIIKKHYEKSENSLVTSKKYREFSVTIKSNGRLTISCDTEENSKNYYSYIINIIDSLRDKIEYK